MSGREVPPTSAEPRQTQALAWSYRGRSKLRPYTSAAHSLCLSSPVVAVTSFNQSSNTALWPAEL